MKKRILSLALVFSIISTLLGNVYMPVNAATEITTTDLFMKYPTYLSNDDMDEGLSKAEAACYAALNSYSATDTAVAVAMTALSEGISVAIRDDLSKFGLTTSTYEEYLKKAAKKYMQEMLANKNTLKAPTTIVSTAFKTVKSTYTAATNLSKEQIISDLHRVATENNISITTADMDDIVDKIYESGSIKEDLVVLGDFLDAWELALEMCEIHAIEMSTLDFLIDELNKSGQSDSDMSKGLKLLKTDIKKSPGEYVIKNYGTKKLISEIAKKVESLVYTTAGVSASTAALVGIFSKFFADYIYTDAKADQITQTVMQLSFISSMEICLSQYRMKFYQNTGTTDDIDTYESLYGAYLSAYTAALDSSYDVCKLKDKFDLGGDCKVWAEEIKTTFTYDTYLRWSKDAVNHDISNGTLNSAGTEMITDALNEETITARLEKLYEMYPYNVDDTWNGNYDGASGEIGFVSKIFSYIFDKKIYTKVDNRYQYILTCESNVRLVGRLEEGDLTATSVKGIFANARIGDIVFASGKNDYAHAMVVTAVSDTGVTVYDCNSKYYKTDPKPYLVQKYEFTYVKLADEFNSHGDYRDKAGISIYRAIRKVNTTNSGTNLYYAEYDDSVNYIIENGVLTGYAGARTTLDIPDGVTEIAANCFKNNTSIKYVYMPDTVVKIGNSAFYGCTNLRYIDLSTGLTAINSSTFYNCSLLGSVTISDSVITIQSLAFYNCTSLSNVKLSKGLETLQYGAFQNCKSLISIEIPKALKVSDKWNDQYGIFKGSGLKNVSFEKGTALIPEALFALCENLEEITIPDTVVTINYTAFYKCTNLKNVTLSNSLTTINSFAFSDCTSLDKITIPDSVTSMGASTFSGCTSLEKVKLPSTQKDIPSSIFYNCEKLSDIALPDTVTTIETSAFYGCESLAKLDLPDNLETIESSAFYGCKALTDITIPEKVTSVGSGAFYNCDALTTATVNSTGSVGSSAFYDCDALTDIEFGGEVTSLGSSICYGCDNLKNIKFGKYITTIPDSAFRLCASLESVTLPRFCTTVASNAFAEDTKLTSAYVPPYVSSIQTNSFSYPAKMTIYGKSGTYAEEYAQQRGTAFVALSKPITTLAYPDDSMKIARYSTAVPKLQIMPDFDTDTITFISGNPSVVTVSETGAVYGKAYGTATVSALSGSGILDRVTVTVVKPASSVLLSKEMVELAAGNSETITATLSPTDATDTVEWTSDDENIATVSQNGRITGVAKGTATITAKAVCGNKTASCLVMVVPAGTPIVDVTGISLSESEQEIMLGGTFAITATVLPQNATNQKITWSSSNTSVATVTDGVVTAKVLGTSVITAKTVKGGFMANCTVTVVPPFGITSLTVQSMGTYGLVNLSAVDMPTSAKVYIAAYDSSGELVELQTTTLNNGAAQAILQMMNVVKLKAFIWTSNGLQSLCDCKEWTTNQNN